MGMTSIEKAPLQLENGHHFSTRWPVLAPLLLLGIELLFRILDIFVLRLDERLGEIILSKSLGFVLVVALAFLALALNPMIKKFPQNTRRSRQDPYYYFAATAWICHRRWRPPGLPFVWHE